VIGHTTDNDAETYSLGMTYRAAGGALWTATLRNSALNHDGYDELLNPGGIDARNTVSPGPSKYNGLEVGWRGVVFGEAVAIELGVEALDPEIGESEVEPYGYIGWRHEFAP
jgi:hypothetical protein